MRLFERLWKSLLRTLNPRKKAHRRQARTLAALRWAVLETLEVRTLFSTLYWDPSASAGLQAGSGNWDATATNWNTAADGSGSRVAWTSGSDAVFSTSGTSTVTISSSVSANSITVSGTGYTVTGGTLTLGGTGPVAMNANGAIAATVAGSAGLNKTGASRLTLSGANTYTGGTTLSAGTTTLSGSGTLGSSSNSLTLNGGTLDLNGTSQTVDSLNGTSGTILDNAAGTNVTLTVGSAGGNGNFGGILSNGSSSGTVALTKIGTGTQILTGSNTNSGTTTISGGVLQLGNLGTTGTLGSGAVVDNATMAFDRSNSVTVANAISGSGAVQQISTGTAVLTGTNTYTGTTTIGAGTLQIGNAGGVGTLGSGDVVDNGTLAFKRSNAVTISNAIGGTGSVTQTGGGTTTLTGANTYTGGTTVSAGTLQLSGTGTLGSSSGGLTLSGGVLDLNGTNQSIDALNGTGGTILNNASGTAVLTTGSNNGGGVYSGVLADHTSGTGALAVTKVGTGTLILKGTNTYSGTTTISNGILQIGNAGTTGTLGTGDVVDNASLVISRTNAYTVPNNISGTGTVTQLSGSTTFTGNNTYTGITSISGSVQLTGATTIQSLSLNTGAVLDLNGHDLSVGTFDGLGGSIVNNGAAPATLIVGSSDADSIIRASMADGSSTLSLTKVGSGTLILKGTNTYSGTTRISNGTLRVGNVGTTGTLGTGNVINNSGLEISRTDALTIGSAISGTGTLSQIASGTTTLTGANTYTGGTIINAGTVRLSDSGSLGSSDGTLNVNASGTLDLNGNDLTKKSLDGFGSGTILNNGSGTATLTIGSSDGGGVFYGAIIDNTSGTGVVALTKIGSGTLMLKGTNTYSGTTMISGGTLRVGNVSDDGTLGTGTLGTGAVVDNANLTISRTNAYTIPNAISGSGSVSVTTGDITLTGTNSYLGGTSIRAGSLTIGSDSALGDVGGSLNFNGNATLRASGDLTLNAGRNIIVANSATATFDTQSYTVTVNGTINGGGGIAEAGMGKLILTAVNTYLRDTTINGGTVEIFTDSGLGATDSVVHFTGNSVLQAGADIILNSQRTIDVDAGITAILDPQGHIFRVDGRVTGGGTLIGSGVGSLTLSSYIGQAEVLAGQSYTLHLDSYNVGQKANATWTIDWGDNTSTENWNEGSADPTHTYGAVGNVTITATAPTANSGLVRITIAMHVLSAVPSGPWGASASKQPDWSGMLVWGWAADGPNQNKVEIYEMTPGGTKVSLATIDATTPFAGLGAAYAIGDNHGFFYDLTDAAIAHGWANGSPHTIYIDSLSNSGGAARTIEIAQIVYTNTSDPLGFVTHANVNGAAGFVYDIDRPITSVPLNVYMNGTVDADTPLTADQSTTFQYGPTPHNFAFAVSADSTNVFSKIAPDTTVLFALQAVNSADGGRNRYIALVQQGVDARWPSGNLPENEISITNHKPIWQSDPVSGNTISGWAYDPDTGSNPDSPDGSGTIWVDLYVDDEFVDRIAANQPRADLAGEPEGQNHGFSFDISAKNAELSPDNHSWTVKFEDSTSYTNGSPTEVEGDTFITAGPVPGSISGTVWRDENGDLLRSVRSDGSLEPGVSGITVYVDADNDGTLDSNELSAITDSEGHYALSDVPPGVYTLRIDGLPGGVVDPVSQHYSIQLNSNDDLQKDFGLDGVSPIVSILSPLTGITSNSPTLTISGIAGIQVGDDGTAYVSIYEGSSPSGPLVATLAATVDPGTGAFRVALPSSLSLSDGTYTLQAMQSDSAGNLGYSDGVTIALDIEAPRVSSITAQVDDGTYSAGAAIPIVLHFDEPVIVSGTPALLLNVQPSGRTAIYQSGSGTEDLLFLYTVQAGDQSPLLDYLSANALVLSSATITDVSGNNILPLLATPGDTGSISSTHQIAIGVITASIVASEPDPTNAQNVSYGVTFSSPVTGVLTDNFDIQSSGLSGAHVLSVIGSGASYTVTVDTGTGDGTLQLLLEDDGTIVDANGLTLNGTGSGPVTIVGPEYTIDRTAPSVPDNLQLEAASTDGVLISWDPSVDNVTTDLLYEIFIDGGSLPIATTSTEFLDSGLIADTTRTYQVRAVDSAGNRSDLSLPLVASAADTVTSGLSLASPASQSAMEGLDQVFNLGAISDDAGSGPWAILVSWGDGTSPDLFTVSSIGNLELNHAYDSHGAFHVVVEATNASGQTAKALFTNDVAYVPPDLEVEGPDSIEQGEPYIVSLISYPSGYDTTTGWTVDWGDGQHSSYDATAIYAEHFYSTPGNYAVMARSTDVDGVHSDSTSVTVLNVPPLIFVAGLGTVQEGDTSELSFLSADRSSATISTWHIDWGDGNITAQGGTTASHTYQSGSGIYDVTVTGDSTEGGNYAAVNDVSLAVLPKAPTAMSATPNDSDPGRIDLSWQDNSQVESGYIIEESSDGSAFHQIATTPANGTSYTIHGLLAGTHYYFKVAAINDAGGSAYTSSEGTTSAPADSNVPSNDDGYSQRVDIGMTLNFYGRTFNQVYVNNNGNITLNSGLGTYTPGSPLDTAYGAIIAPFFADVDTRVNGGTVTFGSAVINGHAAWSANWNNVGYYNRLGDDGTLKTTNTDSRNTFSLTLVDRSDIQAGDFDIIFNYSALSWETGDASGGHSGFGGTPARAGYSNGTGDTGTFYELPGSGASGGLLGLSGQHTYQIRNAEVNLTPYRTGDNYGTAVSDDDRKSADSSNYVILVNDDYTADPDGIDVDSVFNQNQLDAGNAVDLSDHDLAKITLRKVDFQGAPQDGSVELILSNAGAVRIYDSSGKELTSLTESLSDGSGYLASLSSHDVDIYIEGLEADPDFSLAYVYLDKHGNEQSRAEVHITIADPKIVGTEGEDVPTILDGLLPLEVTSALDGGDPNAIYALYQDIQSLGFKIAVNGLHSGQVDELTLRSADTGESFTVDLTDRQAGTISKLLNVLYDADPSGPFDPSELRSALNVDVLSNGTIEFELQTGKDKFTRAVRTALTTITDADLVSDDPDVEKPNFADSGSDWGTSSDPDPLAPTTEEATQSVTAFAAAASSSTAAPLTKDAIVFYLKLIYGTAGEQLLTAYEATGNTIDLHHYWRYVPSLRWNDKSDINGVILGSVKTNIWIADDLDPATAASELYSRLVEASGRGYNGMRNYMIDNYLAPNPSQLNIDQYTQSLQSGIKQGAAAAAALAEAYYQGILISTGEAGNVIMTINDVANGHYLSLVNVVPLLGRLASKTAGALVIKAGDEVVTYDQAMVRRICQQGCFVKGTLVATEIGTIPIENVEAGLRVWAFDQSKGEWSLEPVVKPFIFDYQGDFITVKLQGEDSDITTTGNHPFWVTDGDGLDDRPKAEDILPGDVDMTPEGRWVEARHLRVGDVLRLRSGGATRVQQLTPQVRHDWVYNLWVERIHTYAVGEPEILVHNNTEFCAKALQVAVSDVDPTKITNGATWERYLKAILPKALTVRNDISLIDPLTNTITKLDGVSAGTRYYQAKVADFWVNMANPTYYTAQIDKLLAQKRAVEALGGGATYEIITNGVVPPSLKAKLVGLGFNITEVTAKTSSI